MTLKFLKTNLKQITTQSQKESIINKSPYVVTFYNNKKSFNGSMCDIKKLQS